MNCEHLAPGDEIAIRTGRWHDQPRYRLARVARVVRTTLATECGRTFGRKDGREARVIHDFDADLVPLTPEVRAACEPAAPALSGSSKQGRPRKRDW